MAEATLREFLASGRADALAHAGRFMRIGGALTTVALVVGVGVWGYQLAVRDATGVPVIRAMDGPMRISPEDPGGIVARHMGLSVNEIASDGTAGAVPDRITLAPPPVDLTEEDLPGLGRAVAAEATPAPVSTPTQTPAEAEAAARNLALAESLVRQAPAPEAAASAAPAEAAPTPEDAADAVAAVLAEVAEAAEAPAPRLPAHVVQRSIRPAPRPERFGAAEPQVEAVETVSAPAEVEIDGDTLGTGVRLVQIGAFDDIAAARQEWARVSQLHPALFHDKARVIQSASSAGRAFFRLRVHEFASDEESRRFCAAIEAGDLRCIPVTTR